MEAAQESVPAAALQGLPLELVHQILSHAVLNQNFFRLRMVHSQLNDKILNHSQHLLSVILGQLPASKRTTLLIKDSLLSASRSHPTDLPEATIQLLWLHADLHTSLSLTSELSAQYESYIGFSLSVTHAAVKPGSVESLLIFSAFNRALGTMDSRVGDMPATTQEVLAQGLTNEDFVVSTLTDSFLTFLHEQLTLDDVESLISLAELCSTVVPNCVGIEPSFTGGNAYHFQDKQIGKALLVEQVLWRGLTWLRETLQTPAHSTLAVNDAEATKLGHTPDLRWHGSRADAARITANGLAKLLWRERSRKIARAEKMGWERTAKTKPWVELPFDAAVWRGSAGDM